MNQKNNLIFCKKHSFSYNKYCKQFYQALTWYILLVIISSISEMELFFFFPKESMRFKMTQNCKASTLRVWEQLKSAIFLLLLLKPEVQSLF